MLTALPVPLGGPIDVIQPAVVFNKPQGRGLVGQRADLPGPARVMTGFEISTEIMSVAVVNRSRAIAASRRTKWPTLCAHTVCKWGAAQLASLLSLFGVIPARERRYLCVNTTSRVPARVFALSTSAQ